MLKIEHFYYVIEIAKVGSINKAADNLFLSQPYLSMVLREIENELNVLLFYRHSKGVKLTPEGKLFCEYANKIIDIMYNVKNLRKIENSSNLNLVISSMYSFTILDIFNNFLRDNERVGSIQYEEIPNAFIFDKVCEGVSDIGIVYTSSKDLHKFENLLEEKGLDFKPLAKEPIYAVFSTEHSLAKNDYILLKELKPFQFIVEKIKSPNKGPLIENNILPEVFENLKVNMISFDNNRSLLYYLTKNSSCFTIGQKSLNLTNPFVVNNSLKYVPIKDLSVKMITGYITNKKIEHSMLMKKFIKYLHDFFSTYHTDD